MINYTIVLLVTNLLIQLDLPVAIHTYLLNFTHDLLIQKNKFIIFFFELS